MLGIYRNWPVRHTASLALLITTVAAAAPLNHLLASATAPNAASAPRQRCGLLGLLPAQSETCERGRPPDWVRGLDLDPLYASAVGPGARRPRGPAASFVQLAAAAALRNRAAVAQAAAANGSSQALQSKGRGGNTTSKAEFEKNLEHEPWRRVGHGHENGSIVRPFNNDTERQWIKDALQNATRKKVSRLKREGAAKEVHMLARTAVLPSVAIVMLSMLVSSYLSSFPYAITKFVPECLITVSVAGLLGFFIRCMIHQGIMSQDGFELVDASILNLVLLPIIIFNGGWSINLPHFASQFTYCLIFAVGGTFVTMIIVGYSFWWLANLLGWHCMSSIRADMAFAALISATDPVATLATYAELGIARRQPLLNTLVLGESLINDAVAIAFFDAVNSMHQATWHGMHTGIAARMMILLFGSMVFGIFVASVLIFVMRVAQLPGQTSMEILYMFLAPFLIFSLADTLELSGIIAVLFAGIMMKTYGTQHLTGKGRHLANEFLEVLAKLADTGVFVLCGTSTALIDTLDGVKFGLMAVLLCLFGRAVATLVCTASSNALKHCREKNPVYITSKHAFMIWLGGLRGGIALVLALELDESWCGARTKEMIINTTFIVICAHLLLCGGTTELFLVALGMVPPPKDGRRKQPVSEDGEPDEEEEEEELPEEYLRLVVTGDRSPRRIGHWMHSWFEFLLVGEFVEIQRQISKLTGVAG